MDGQAEDLVQDQDPPHGDGARDQEDGGQAWDVPRRDGGTSQGVQVMAVTWHIGSI